MADETPMSDAQACELARQMENHFRAFGQLHQVLEKALVAGSQVEQCNQMLDMLKPQVDEWLKREADLAAAVSVQELEYQNSKAKIADDLAAQLAQVSDTVRDAKDRSVETLRGLEQDQQAMVFTNQQIIKGLDTQRDELERIIKGLETTKANLSKEFATLIGG